MFTVNYLINVSKELRYSLDEIDKYINFVLYIMFLPFVIILDIAFSPFTLLYFVTKKIFNF